MPSSIAKTDSTEMPATDSRTTTLAKLSGKLDYLGSKIGGIDSIIEKVNIMESRMEAIARENSQLKNKIAELEDRMDELESVGRSCNLVLSSRENAGISSSANPEQAVIDLFKCSMKYDLPRSDLLFVKKLGKKLTTESSVHCKLLIKVTNIELKKDLLISCKKVKPAGLYLNEDLTLTRSKILFALRKAKRYFPRKFAGYGSMNGSVYALVKPPNPAARNQRLYINNHLKLEDFCTRELGVSAADIVEGRITE